MLTALDPLGERRYVYNKHNRMENYQRTLVSSKKMTYTPLGNSKSGPKTVSERTKFPSTGCWPSDVSLAFLLSKNSCNPRASSLSCSYQSKFLGTQVSNLINELDAREGRGGKAAEEAEEPQAVSLCLNSQPEEQEWDQEDVGSQDKWQWQGVWTKGIQQC